MKTPRVLVLTTMLLIFFTGVAISAPFNVRDPQIDVKPTSGPDEETLQNILDNVLPGEGFSAEGDQNPAALWQSSDQSTSSFSVTIFAPWDGIFGVYSALTGDMIPILDVNAPSGYDGEGGIGPGSEVQKEFYMSGDTLSFDSTFLDPTLTYGGFGSSFGFYWERKDTGAISYTEDSMNGTPEDPVARALTYFLEEGTMVDRNHYINPDLDPTTVRGNDDWILAFEAGSDDDFQDAVFLVEDMTPVPEPATILLFGAGLLGLAAYGRKKGFRRS